MAVRHPIDLSGIAGPITQLGLCVVGERADHGDAFRIVCGERQGSVVLKQRHGFASQLEVEPLMLVGADGRVDTFLIRQARILEQAQTELECENAGDGGIDQ